MIDQVQKDNGQQRVAIAKRDGRRKCCQRKPVIDEREDKHVVPRAGIDLLPIDAVFIDIFRVIL